MIDSDVRLTQVRERLNSFAGIGSATRGCDGRFRLVKGFRKKIEVIMLLLCLVNCNFEMLSEVTGTSGTV
jgi:hypothetical protein